MVSPRSSPICLLRLATAAVLLLHTPFLLAAAVSVEDTCKAASANVDYDFCVSVIRSAPSSASANTTESWASVAVDATLATADDGSEIIHALLIGGRGRVDDAKTKRALESCSGKYRRLTSKLAEARRAIGSGKMRAAKKDMRAAAVLPDECEEGRAVAKAMFWAPVTDTNSNTKQLAALALAITSLL